MTDYKRTVNSQEEFDIFFRQGLNLSMTHFKFKVALNVTSNPNRPFSFEDCLFEQGADFNSIAIERANFKNSIFKQAVSFFNCTFQQSTTFENVHFEANVIFDNSSFQEKCRFNNAIFGKNVTFENTKFKDLADFYHVVFSQNHIFFKTDFRGVTVFSRALFNKNVLFTYSLLDGIIIFRHAVFREGLDISLSNITGELNFFNLELSNYRAVATPTSTDEYEEMVKAGENIPIINKKETFRIIKDNLTKQDNKIDAQKYHRLEMKSFSQEMLFKSKTWKIWKWPFVDGSINLLNYCSNNFGSSWAQAILFTFVCAILCFSISINFLSNYPYALGNGKTWEATNFGLKYFFELLLPFHKTDIMDNFTPTSIFFVIDFMGRVLISYGIYQTISAFRKYNKK